ncbi:MAG: pyridoxal phosphate-dependent aminotransferase [Alphaproteobacteria bacterium]|nr:pyridoxal phosphate-dependent aminotransferase [Alphaproteobacteria bacterium]
MITTEQLHQLLLLADPEARAAQYAAEDKDFINLAVAENVLIFDYLKEQVFGSLTPLVVGETKYTRNYGDDELRTQTARLFSDHFGFTVPPNWIFGVGGVSAALECLAFSLLAPGDEVLVPAPAWQGFRWCFEQRPRCRLRLFTTKNHQITVKDVEDALKAYPNAKALVLTNPHNPLGINYAKENLEAIYDLVLKRTKLHIISDEIYALSQTVGVSPAFVSAFTLDAYTRATADQRARVHMVWGLAKDFGLSGFKAGFIVSSSQKVHHAVGGKAPDKEMAWFTPMDSLKQWAVKQMLSRTDGGRLVTTRAMERYRVRLTEARGRVGAELVRQKLPFKRDSSAAQFFWLDLSAWLGRAPDSGAALYPEIDPQEERLAAWIRDEAKVGLLPGRTLSNPVSGWFRMCYTATDTDQVLEAVKRVGELLHGGEAS